MKSFSEFEVGEIYKVTFKPFKHSTNTVTLFIKIVSINLEEGSAVGNVVLEQANYYTGEEFHFMPWEQWSKEEMNSIIKL